MIRLRRMFERGRAHPILGPILLVVLVLLLAMVFLHVAQEGMEAAAAWGAVCVGIATAFGLLVTNRLRPWRPEKLMLLRRERGPPGMFETCLGTPTTSVTGPSSLPLRR